MKFKITTVRDLLNRGLIIIFAIGLSLFFGGVLSLSPVSAEDIKYVKQREITVPVKGNNYIFEGEPGFEGRYSANVISKYTEGWEQPPDYTDEHILVKHCRSDWYWLSAEYAQASSDELKYRRALVNMSSGEVVSYDGKAKMGVLDVACTSDSIYLVGMNGNRGKSMVIENGVVNDLTSKFNEISYTYKLLEIDYNGDYFLVSSYYGYIYKLTKDHKVTRVSGYRSGWQVGVIEWIEDRNRWMTFPIGSDWNNWDTGWFNPDSGEFTKVTSTRGYAVFDEGNQILLKDSQQGVDKITIIKGNKEVELSPPEELQGKNKYGQWYWLSAAQWTGKYWLLYYSDNYNSTRVYALYDNRFYFVTEFDKGLNYTESSDDYLGLYSSKIMSLGFNSNSEDGKFTLSDKEGKHQVKVWKSSGLDLSVQEFTYLYDKTSPPQVEASIEEPEVCTKRKRIVWDKVKDNLSPVRYQILLGGEELVTTRDNFVNVDLKSFEGDKGEVKIITIDKAGNKSKETVLEIMKPEPNLKLISLNGNPAELDNVELESDELILKGSASVGSVISISLDGDKIKEVDIDEDGNWKFSHDESLDPGDYVLKLESFCGYNQDSLTVKLSLDEKYERETVLETEPVEIEPRVSSVDHEKDGKLWVWITLVTVLLVVGAGVGYYFWLRSEGKANIKEN